MNRCIHLNNKKKKCVNNLAVCPAMLPASLWKVPISSSLGRNNDCYLRFTLTKVFSTSDSHHRRSTEPSRSPLHSVMLSCTDPRPIRAAVKIPQWTGIGEEGHAPLRHGELFSCGTNILKFVHCGQFSLVGWSTKSFGCCFVKKNDV